MGRVRFPVEDCAWVWLQTRTDARVAASCAGTNTAPRVSAIGREHAGDVGEGAPCRSRRAGALGPAVARGSSRLRAAPARKRRHPRRSCGPLADEGVPA